MRHCLFLLCIAVCGVARAVTPLQTTSASGNGTLTVTFGSSVTAHSTLLLEVYTASAAPSSVTESLSETVHNRVSWAGGAATKIAAYDVINTAGGSGVSFTITDTGNNITAIIAEYSQSVANSFDQATTVSFGTSTSAASASLTPSESGELAVGVLGAADNGSSVTYSWSNGYVQELKKGSTGGSAPTVVLADQVYGSTSPLTAAATLSASETWSMAQIFYKPLATPFVPAPVYSSGKPLLSRGHIVY